MSVTVLHPRPCLYCGIPTRESDQYCCSACRLLADEAWIQTALTTPVSIKNRAYASNTVQNLYNASSHVEEKRFRISLQGLQCSSCVHLLERLPQYLPDVLNACVDFARSEIYVTTNDKISLSQLLSFIEEMGYSARPLQASETGDEIRLIEDRNLLIRLGVAGACAGNIMLFTVPLYGGLTGTIGEIFKLLTFVLFMPILFYSATPIYRSAWSGLKFSHLNVDVPLVVALWAGFLASLANFFRGEGGLYLDSTAGFIFLILVSRWFLRTSQHRWCEGPLSSSPWKNEVVVVRDEKGPQETLASELTANACFELAPGQVVPVDAVLLSQKGLFDTSWMTGESQPRVAMKEMKIAAGYRCLAAPVQLQATTTVQSSELAMSLRRIETELLSDSHRLNLFDQASKWLLSFVFLISAVLLCVGPWFGLDMSQAFERALSLLIVACPCALAFGGPLAYGMALRKAAAAGVLVRSADVLDRVLECETVVVDKTGTLTEGKLQLVEQKPDELPNWIKDLILSLEKKSSHPVAEAFRSTWINHRHDNLILHDVHEIPGEKIFGLYGGRLYCLQAGNRSDNHGLTINLTQDSQTLARFVFDDRIRPEAKAILQKLNKRFTLEILSGDRDDRVQRLIREVDVAGLSGRGDCLPKEKASLVKNKGRCLMIGDGINDLEALASAHVGMAMNGAVEHGLLQGSGYFLKPGLQPVLTLIQAAKKARTLTRRNLAFALVYNLAAGAAACLGLINPLVAALLMPVSSGLILISTWAASR